MKNQHRAGNPGWHVRKRAGAARQSWLSTLAVIAWIAVLAGCGGSPYKFAPVSGTVTLDGNPLADIVVTFQPLAEGSGGQAGTGSYGVTDTQGHYTLKAADGSSEGAVVGRHRVTFTSNAPVRDAADDTAAPPAKEVIPPQVRLNPPEFEVPAGGTEQADFALTSG